MGSELAHVAAAPFHGWGLIRLLCHTGLGELSFLLGSWNLIPSSPPGSTVGGEKEQSFLFLWSWALSPKLGPLSFFFCGSHLGRSWSHVQALSEITRAWVPLSWSWRGFRHPWKARRGLSDPSGKKYAPYGFTPLTLPISSSCSRNPVLCIRPTSQPPTSSSLDWFPLMLQEVPLFPFFFLGKSSLILSTRLNPTVSWPHRTP